MWTFTQIIHLWRCLLNFRCLIKVLYSSILAACMTWDLAESGKDFITTLVNRTDAVPSFSLVSAAQLRAEVLPLFRFCFFVSSLVFFKWSLYNFSGVGYPGNCKLYFFPKGAFCYTCFDYNYWFVLCQHRWPFHHGWPIWGIRSNTRDF